MIKVFHVFIIYFTLMLLTIGCNTGIDTRKSTKEESTKEESTKKESTKKESTKKESTKKESTKKELSYFVISKSLKNKRRD